MKKDELLASVVIVRRKTCCYDGMIHEHEPRSCDCKYGISGLTPGNFGNWHLGEKTGCPELRNVEMLLTNMTEAEYERITNRGIKKAKRKKKADVAPPAWIFD